MGHNGLSTVGESIEIDVLCLSKDIGVVEDRRDSLSIRNEELLLLYLYSVSGHSKKQYS